MTKRSLPIRAVLTQRPFSGGRWQKLNDAPCVQKSPKGYDGILLGDVVFQVQKGDGACACRAIFFKVISCGVASPLREFRIM